MILKIRFAVTWLLASCHAVPVPSAAPFTGYRDDYESPQLQPALDDGDLEGFLFHRFQSPTAIKASLQGVKKRNNLKKFQGKDGRKGLVSSTRLSGDWVLAESQQVAVNCTVDEVLSAYMSSELQEKWNPKDMIKCLFQKIRFDEDGGTSEQESRQEKWISKLRSKNANDNTHGDKSGVFYRQDLVLKSQRVIRSHTGVMRYCQRLIIDKIGKDKYSVLINLDPNQQSEGGTPKRPFESLAVHVGLQQDGKDVNIYATGVMKVNRKVVPNLVIFDASGIAGSMAGKGTLWLSPHFEQRQLSNRGP